MTHDTLYFSINEILMTLRLAYQYSLLRSQMLLIFDLNYAK